MKLWLLRPVGYGLEDGWERDTPWAGWYDKAFGFVVRAETEQDARGYAELYSGDECLWTRPCAWLDPELATCVELLPDGDPGLVIMDYSGG